MLGEPFGDGIASYGRHCAGSISMQTCVHADDTRVAGRRPESFNVGIQSPVGREQAVLRGRWRCGESRLHRGTSEAGGEWHVGRRSGSDIYIDTPSAVELSFPNREVVSVIGRRTGDVVHMR